MYEYVNYRDLLISNSEDEYISYSQLLKTYEWKNFRDIIINRDNNQCQVCFKNGSIKYGKFYIRKPTEEEKDLSLARYSMLTNGDDEFKPKYSVITGVRDENPIILHVHHKHYFIDTLPWDYDINDLITVCHQCHQNIHQASIIPVYTNKLKSEIVKLTPCERCFGTGFLNQFYYYENGICFNCNGNKYIEYC